MDDSRLRPAASLAERFSEPSMNNHSNTSRFVLGDIRFGDFVQKPRNNLFRGEPFRLGLKVRRNTMPQYRDGHFADIAQVDAGSAVHGGHCFASLDQELSGSGTGS